MLLRLLENFMNPIRKLQSTSGSTAEPHKSLWSRLSNGIKNKKILFLILDLLLLVFIAWFSFLLRFEWLIPPKHLIHLRQFIILSLLLSLPLFYWQKLYQFSWAYVSIADLYRITIAVTFSTFIIGSLVLLFRESLFLGFPRSVILINYFFTLLGVSGLRIGKRVFAEIFKKPTKGNHRVLIVGAGEAGVELARSLAQTPYNLVGFIDDNPAKQKTLIHGYPILGKREETPTIVKDFSVEEVIIAFPSLPSKIIKETVEICRQARIPKIKILPSIREIMDGKITLAKIREVSIEDLLFREEVSIDKGLIKNFLYGKKVLVTGAAGSIGSYLCREITNFYPEKLIAFDQNETGIFRLENSLKKEFPEIPQVFEIGDITNSEKVNFLLEKHKPDIIFHAAAYKHVPLMEAQPEEAVKNNIFGTLAVAEAAVKNNVEKLIFISTDKAINPTSVMGASKQVGERICLSLNKKQTTKFCAVRFGNVLDSQGNVIEIFKEQIKKGGPLEITHEKMKRYFMTTKEACLLVLEAAALSKEGEVFVLDMGEPVKIIDLAKEMIKLAGFRPDIDIPIVISQPRPGEKLFEEILTDSEKPTKYEKIFIAKPDEVDEKKLFKNLEELAQATKKMEREKIIKIFKEILPNYQPTVPTSDIKKNYPQEPASQKTARSDF